MSDRTISGTQELSGRDRPPLVMAEPKDRDPEEAQSNPLGLVFIAALFALLWFGAGPRYFMVVVGLIIMIFLHELGHYLTARWTGMKVTQFFLFMGPRIWSFHRNGIEYGVRSLPIGAFVRIIGMHNLDPVDNPEDEAKAYMHKSYPRRMLVITAGSIMHFIQAILLFLIVTTFIGLDDTSRWSIGQISRLETGETPAVVADLEPGDTIVAVDGVDATDWRDLRLYIRDRPGGEITLSVLDETGAVTDRSTTLATIADVDEDGEAIEVGFLGVAPSFEKTPRSPVVAVETFGRTFWGALSSIPVFLSPSTFSDLATLMFEGSAEVDVNDPEAARPISVVGAVRIAGEPEADLAWPISLLAILNIFIGLINLLPLLPLDGGHAAIATYERLRSRKGEEPYHIDVAKLLPLTYAVVLILGFIMISTVYLDIVRPISS